MEINKQQLTQFVMNLQQTEQQYFSNSNNNNDKIINTKLNKLQDKKMKLINKLKYDITSLIRLIDEIENEIKTPTKIKVVGV